MTDDIVERLRGMTTGDRSDSWTVHLLPFDELHTALMDAADEIERLRAAGAALHALLDEMHRCGRRQPGLIEALEGWEAATKADADGAR